MNLETGCYIDGTWGQYAVGRLLSLAESYGWVNGYKVNEDNQNDFGSQVSIGVIDELADEAEVWLNDNIAPAGTSFGWFDGEFYLWTDSDWSEV
jgi:hypothetical protein